MEERAKKYKEYWDKENTGKEMVAKTKRIENYRGVQCISDKNNESSYPQLSFFTMTMFGAILQLPMNCRMVQESKTEIKNETSGTSLKEAALDTTGNSLSNTQMALSFHRIVYEEDSRINRRMANKGGVQSQHYFDFQSEIGYLKDCKLYTSGITATTPNQNNILAAELIFNHKFDYYELDDTSKRINMTPLIKKLSDQKITNNDKLYSFLNETLGFGDEFYFDKSNNFCTNLKLYSDFVSLTSGIIMSCIEGNHRLYAALRQLGMVNGIICDSDRSTSTPASINPNAAIMQDQLIDIISFRDGTIGEQVADGIKISKKFISDKNTFIPSGWSEYVLSKIEYIKQHATYDTLVDLRYAPYCDKADSQVSTIRLVKQYKQLFEHMCNDFNSFPVSESIIAPLEAINAFKENFFKSTRKNPLTLFSTAVST